MRQTETFRKWFPKLRDERAATAITARLDRLAFGHAGDVRSVGKGVSELRIHHGPGYRVYFRRQGSTIIILLCGGNKSSQRSDIRIAQSPRQPNERKAMTEELTTFDPADHLKSDQAIADFMSAAFETNDPAYVAHALGVVARARGMTEIARRTKLSREQLYRSFSTEGNPPCAPLWQCWKQSGSGFPRDRSKSARHDQENGEVE